MTEEILELMNIRKKVKNNPAEYRMLNKQIQKKCREAKESWIRSKCNEIERKDKHNATKQMYADIKELTGDGRGNSSSGCFKDKNGDPLFEKEQILNRWAEYVGDLFADKRPPLPTPRNNERPPILISEVRNALKSPRMERHPAETG